MPTIARTYHKPAWPKLDAAVDRALADSKITLREAKELRDLAPTRGASNYVSGLISAYGTGPAFLFDTFAGPKK